MCMVLTGFFAAAGATATNLADAGTAAADPDNGRKPTSSMPTAHTSEKSGGSAAAAGRRCFKFKVQRGCH